MLDASRIQLNQLLYSDVSGTSQVYAGCYRPVEPDGRETELRVAVKCVELPTAHTEFFNGLMQELTIQMKLEECKYVCKCYGYYTDDRRVYIVMEHLEKDMEKDVQERTPDMRKYTEKELLEYLRQVAFALQYAKRKNIAHRDIKPQNILLGAEGFLKLVDFGSGSISDGKAQKLTGTPLYMSPEQHPDFRRFQETGSLPTVSFNPYFSDVYSLAITFLHLALLRAPLDLLAATEPRKAALMGYLIEVKRGYPDLYALLAVMLSEQSHLRPAFWEILKRVNELIPEQAEEFPVLETPISPNPSTESSLTEEPTPSAYSYPEFNSQYPDAPVYIASIAETQAAYLARIYTACAGCQVPDYIENLQDFGPFLVHSTCLLLLYPPNSQCPNCSKPAPTIKKPEAKGYFCKACQSLLLI